MEEKMAELEQNLLNALEAVEQDKPCHCNEQSGTGSGNFDVFGSDLEGESSNLEGRLDAALSGLLSDSESPFASLENLSVEDELAFAELEEPSRLSLEDVLAVTEKYPGLKITFSY
jgi:hypothetical protein